MLNSLNDFDVKIASSHHGIERERERRPAGTHGIESIAAHPDKRVRCI